MLKVAHGRIFAVARWVGLRFFSARESGGLRTTTAHRDIVLVRPMVRERFCRKKNITVFVRCVDERARVARVVRVWETALLTLKIALQLIGGV